MKKLGQSYQGGVIIELSAETLVTPTFKGWKE